MSRKPGGKTLELSPDDDAALEALRAAYGNAPRGWFGGILLRYGMENVAAVWAKIGDEGAQAQRRLRGAVVPLRKDAGA